MASKPDRPKRPTLRLWDVEFETGECIQVEGLHRAEARHYSVSHSREDGLGGISHYRRVKSVRLARP